MNYQNVSLKKYEKEYKKSDNMALRHNYFIQFKEEGNELKIDENWMSGIEKSMPFQLIKNKIKRSIQHRNLKSGMKFSQFYASTFDQLLVGFGDVHIHETSLNFHPVYGNPYISGSMLKGISRAQAMQDIKSMVESKIESSQNIYFSSLSNLVDYYPLTKEDSTIKSISKAAETKISVNEIVNNKIEKKKDTTFTLSDNVLELFKVYFDLRWEGESQNIKERDNQQLRDLLPEFWFSRIIFGNQGGVGSITFHDAFTNNNVLNLARFTPHNQDYFKKDNRVPPADYQKPIPLIYLAIPKLSKFFFELSTSMNCPDELFKKAEFWLQTALSTRGVGAKTSSGFGYFTDFELLSQSEIENSDYGFLQQEIRFEIELKEGNKNRVEEAIEKLKKSELTETNKGVLLKCLTSDEYYSQFSEKADIIKQICNEIENGCLKNLPEEKTRSILKTLDRFANGKQIQEIKDLKNKLFPVDSKQVVELQIRADNLKTVFADIQAGKYENQKKEYCLIIINLLKKNSVQTKFKPKFVKEVNDFCQDILKN